MNRGSTAPPATETAPQIPVLVMGAGSMGRLIVRGLNDDQSHGRRHVPVGILDDDPSKTGSTVDGVPVIGSRGDIGRVAHRTGAQALIIAIASLPGEDMREISESARDASLEVLILPPVNELFHLPRGSDLRHLDLEDVLGRQRIELDQDAIHAAVSGRRVLVTGAGGSIGAELCRQLVKYAPRRLVLLDRDESALHAAQMSLTGRALLDDGSLALCDIRDADALGAIFDRERPEVVFHAAALKHLTLLEQFPLEAWKSNVLGTLNVLEASRDVRVDTFVNVSTDKAAWPSSVLGFSKRLGERLTASFAGGGQGTYVSVRFGNVLGSRGSVVAAFTEQIERGGPVTVTHPDVERFFMLIPEACQLVLQACAIGSDGEVMVLAMGKPVKIADLARTLIKLAGRSGVDIEFTGLRPGEKLSEQLFVPGEAVSPSRHPLVNRVCVPPIDPTLVREQHFVDAAAARTWMAEQSGGRVNHQPDDDIRVTSEGHIFPVESAPAAPGWEQTPDGVVHGSHRAE